MLPISQRFQFEGAHAPVVGDEGRAEQLRGQVADRSIAISRLWVSARLD